MDSINLIVTINTKGKEFQTKRTGQFIEIKLIVARYLRAQLFILGLVRDEMI